MPRSLNRTTSLAVAWLLTCGFSSLFAAEISVAPRESFSDPVAGYSLLVPSSYRRLTENEVREIFSGMSKLLGKEIGERAPKRAPAWFVGKPDPAKPNDAPPRFAIGFAELDQPIDPAQITAYRDELAEKHKREGDKIGNMHVSVVSVDGIASLQEEYDYEFGNSTERARLIRLAIPGKGRWYELYFSFSPSQEEGVRAALKELLDSFKVMEHPPQSSENRDKWLRVLYYTVGFGLAGVLISILLQKFSRNKEPRP